VDALEDCQSVLGDRLITVARELTKMHEELLRGPISLARDHFQEKAPKGELTLIIAGADPEQRWSESQLVERLDQELASGKHSPSQLAKSLASQSGWPRSKIYDLIQNR
jgi:16S rRNA (cytidine1402-2'-O)-methyltransferase